MNPHWNFVIAAYGVTVVTVAIMIVWLMKEHRALKRKLAAMEAQKGRFHE